MLGCMGAGLSPGQLQWASRFPLLACFSWVFLILPGHEQAQKGGNFTTHCHHHRCCPGLSLDLVQPSLSRKGAPLVPRIVGQAGERMARRVAVFLGREWKWGILTFCGA